MDAAGFSEQLGAFAGKDVPELVKVTHQKITLEALRRLVFRTAVDTGRARGNWQVGVNERPPGPVEVQDLLPSADVPRSTLPSLSAAGQAAVRAGEAAIQEIPAFSVSHVTNNVAYILRLEDGSSRQSPQGMMAITFEELAQMFP